MRVWNSAGGRGHAQVLMTTSARTLSGLLMANDSPVGPPQSWQTTRDARQPKLAHEAHQIGGVSIERVRVLTCRLLRKAEANHIRHDDSPAGLDQRSDHIAVEEAPGRIAMKEQNRIAITLIDIVHPPTVDPRISGGERPFLTDTRRQLENILGHRILRRAFQIA